MALCPPFMYHIWLYLRKYSLKLKQFYKTRIQIYYYECALEWQLTVFTQLNSIMMLANIKVVFFFQIENWNFILS